jgi:quercetin dioxygenase-like cupin family protein
MTRISAFFRLALVLAASVSLSAQAVPLNKEPHHKVLLDTLLLRILDITVQPGETTLEHVHENDIATVALGSASTRTRRTGEDWGPQRVRPVGSLDITEYAGNKTSHVVENNDKTPYRLIAVENYRTGTFPMRKTITAAGTTVLKETRAFAAYDVKLDASTPQTEHNHEVPTVAVIISGTITNQGTNGEEPYPVKANWVFIPAAQSHTIVTTSPDTHIVEIEVR